MPARHVTIPHLKAWREYKLMSQAELREKTGLAVSSISKLENGGQANYATIVKLAEALNLSREQLVREKPPTE